MLMMKFIIEREWNLDLLMMKFIIEREWNLDLFLPRLFFWFFVSGLLQTRLEKYNSSDNPGTMAQEIILENGTKLGKIIPPRQR